MTNIIQRLIDGMEKEHLELLEVASRLRRAEPKRQRAELLAFLHQLFELHAATEEESLYAALDRSSAFREVSGSLQGEHLRIEEHFILLGSLSEEAEQWSRNLEELESLLRHHFARETGEFARMLPGLDEFSLHWADRRYRQVRESVGVRTA